MVNVRLGKLGKHCVKWLNKKNLMPAVKQFWATARAKALKQTWARWCQGPSEDRQNVVSPYSLKTRGKLCLKCSHERDDRSRPCWRNRPHVSCQWMSTVAQISIGCVRPRAGPPPRFNGSCEYIWQGVIWSSLLCGFNPTEAFAAVKHGPGSSSWTTS